MQNACGQKQIFPHKLIIPLANTMFIFDFVSKSIIFGFFINLWAATYWKNYVVAFRCNINPPKNVLR